MSDAKDLKNEKYKDILVRLRRIEGQVRGIQKMLQEDKDISQVVIQVQAITSALDSVRTELIKTELKNEILKSLDNITNLIK